MDDLRPPIVFMSPVIPAFSGNGLAMRAARNLEALAGRFTVHLLVIAMYGGQDGSPSEEVLQYCASWKRILAQLPADAGCGWSLRSLLAWGQGRLPLEWGGWSPGNQAEADAFFAATKCLRLWVFRLYLLPWAKGWLDRGGKAWVDIDELESKARTSHAELLLRTGEQVLGLRMCEQAEACRQLENRHLRRFERIVTASELEAERIEKALGGLPVEVWPNVVSVPWEIPAPRPDDGTWRLLFIGSLGHYPNREAIHFAVREVLPRLQALVPRRIVLCVAGAGAAAHRAGFEGLPQLEWLGTVPEVESVYAEADMVLVPLHAGGGTRIKILEAFAHGKPVVSTHLGAEGLEVAHERELLIADDPAEIARACADLFCNPRKGKRLAEAGLACFSARYAPDRLTQLAAALLRSSGLSPAE